MKYLTLSRVGLALLLASLASCDTDRGEVAGRAPIEGGELAYRVIGAGRDTVIVVAGGPGRPMDYLEAAVKPLTRGLTFVLYDGRGVGRSSAAPTSSSLTTDVEDLEALRTRLGASKVSLLGHHTGAAVAAHYAVNHPGRVNRLVLVSPYPISQGFVWAWSLLDRDTTLFRHGALEYAKATNPATARAFCDRYWFWYFVPVFVPNDLPPASAPHAVCDGPPNSLLDPSARQLAWLKSANAHDWRGQFAGISAPTLVIEGVTGAPRHLFQTHAETWALAFPNGRVQLLKGAALLPWLSRPTEFREAVGTFLHGEWPSGAVRPAPPPDDQDSDR